MGVCRQVQIIGGVTVLAREPTQVFAYLVYYISTFVYIK